MSNGKGKKKKTKYHQIPDDGSRSKVKPNKGDKPTIMERMPRGVRSVNARLVKHINEQHDIGRALDEAKKYPPLSLDVIASSGGLTKAQIAAGKIIEKRKAKAAAKVRRRNVIKVKKK